MNNRFLDRLDSLGFRLGTLYFSVFFVAILLFSAAMHFYLAKLVDGIVNEYGQIVARQVAQSAVNDIINRNLLGLHTTLDDLVHNPSVTTAAIYDVEQKLLAQAGSTPNEVARPTQGDLHYFTQPITFDDSIAGTLVLTLNASSIDRLYHKLQLALLVTGLLGLCTTFIISFKLSRQAHQLYTALQQQLDTMHPEGETQNTYPQSWHKLSAQLGRISEQVRQHKAATMVVPEVVTAPCARVVLLAHCGNLDRLQQQLGLRELEQITRLLTHYVDGATQLYDAEHLDSPCAGVCLAFPVGDDIADTVFRAICCATVLDGLLTQLPHLTGMNSATLDCRFSIDWLEPTGDVPEVIANLQRGRLFDQLRALGQHTQPHKVAVSDAVMAKTSLHSQRVVLEKITGENINVAGMIVQDIPAVYRDLLDQQVQQLLAAHVQQVAGLFCAQY